MTVQSGLRHMKLFLRFIFHAQLTLLIETAARSNKNVFDKHVSVAATIEEARDAVV